MKPKVTVIVPAYNSEKYIEKCIETVNEQTFKEYEMLIINDGSTDHTLEIIENKMKEYDWLRVISIENHGQGYARNLGVREAKGDYILFLDSDDLLKPETLELTVNKMEKEQPDAVFFDWLRYYEDEDIYKKAKAKEFFDKDVLKGEETLELLSLKVYFTVSNLYSRKFLLENNVKYGEGYLYEDTTFLVSVAVRANKISIIKEPLYIVVSNSNSVTQRSYDTNKHADGFLKAVEECLKVLNNSEYESVQYYNYYIYAITRFIVYYTKRTPKNYMDKFLKQFVDLFSTQNIDYSENTGKCNILEQIVDKKIYTNKDYAQLKKLIANQRVRKYLSKYKKKIKSVSDKFYKLKKKIIKILKEDYYIKQYKKSIYENQVFIQSKNSSDLAGNMFYIMQEIHNNFKKFKIVLTYNAGSYEKIKGMLEKYNLNNVKLIKNQTREFFRAMARSKYLFTDTSFNSMYIKRKEQIVVNTWHGTPLKKMARDVFNRVYDLGNVQKCFIVSDYLTYPNKYMEDIMLDAYMIRNITNSKVMESGYPRNSIFYNKERIEEIKKNENLQGKQIMVYMPTWRGIMTKRENKRQIQEIQGFFKEIDEKLTDDQILYIKLHVFVKSSIDCSNYKHIKEFPQGYETYDFLNVADILITDYSSVFFDYANSGKKIILFTYDKDDYLSTRGIYIDFDKLPFPKVYTASELIEEINNKEKIDYKEFVDNYCGFDRKNAPKEICQYLFEGKETVKINNDFKNNKKNIIIYAGKKTRSRTVKAYLELFDEIDFNSANYTFLIDSEVLQKKLDFVAKIPYTCGFIPYKKELQLTIRERIKRKIAKNKKQAIMQAYKRDAIKRFGEFEFDEAIVYSNKKEIRILLENISKKVTINE